MSRSHAGTPATPTRTHRARAASAALLALVLATLSACVGMPTSGPVEVGVERVSDQGAVEPLGDPPPQDGAPEDIVRGFLGASAAGFSRDPAGSETADDFRNAREYLSGETRRSWSPRERVVVYSTASSPDIRMEGESQVRVDVRVAARIDAEGRYAQAGPDAEETLMFDLVQDSDGQWRISGLEDGVVLSEPNFEAIYRSATLYFLSQDAQYLVPETRWFPLRNLATSIVRALLAGPSDWLRDAVRTAIPEGAALQPDAVSVDADGVAAVSLAAGGLPSEPDDRALMQAQLEASLRIARVRTVEVSAAGVGLGADAVQLARGQDWGGSLEAVQGDALVELSGGALVPVEDVGSLAGLDARDPARDGSGALRVMLSGPDRLVTVPTTEDPSQLLLTGTDLVAPSVDRLGWVWTASGDAQGGLVAVAPGGDVVDVEAEWLQGRTVRSVRVALDASRVAVVSSGSDGVHVDVASVVRDDSGTPQVLGAAWRTGVTLVDATRVVWVDESTLGVLGRSGSTTTAVYHLVPLSGQVQARPAIVDSIDIAGGKGDGVLYVATSRGELYARSGSSWTTVGTGVRDPSFPG
ncbi:LpqB family beta-propeller domain-containing protein [Cellulomonas endometrii]|uniref:LpqB family beta-propeller domain-containing protein n=1 Tax=Cellulomonas endometrii TaxID=3036301 RepID=UPI0024AE09FE|nr:LpqB family beta-propeller domain-containing protein [Cellulomonas endometrii]